MYAALTRKAGDLSKVIVGINRHPLAGRHRLLAYYKFFYWQFISRLKNRNIEVAFTPKCRLSVKRGMTGATGNIYLGLHDFPEMAFLLHFLRSQDLFLDIGANVGTYTVLASGHVGCKTFAFEPISSTFQALQKNLEVNRLNSRTKAFECAVGARVGKLKVTSSFDTVNRVVGYWDLSEAAEEVDVITVDEALTNEGVPALVKIDVEGFEAEVIEGMKKTMAKKELKGIIIELNGSGGRYGYNEEKIHETLLQQGFSPFSYEPFKRNLVRLQTHCAFNTIYLRDLEFVNERIHSGSLIGLFNERF